MVLVDWLFVFLVELRFTEFLMKNNDFELNETSKSTNVASPLDCSIAEPHCTEFLPSFVLFSDLQVLPDDRKLLGYVVSWIEAPFQNVTLYDGRDYCGGDGYVPLPSFFFFLPSLLNGDVDVMQVEVHRPGSQRDADDPDGPVGLQTVRRLHPDDDAGRRPAPAQHRRPQQHHLLPHPARTYVSTEFYRVLPSFFFFTG